jgi:hypothetical protein
VAEIPDDDLAALLDLATVALAWQDGTGRTSGIELADVITHNRPTLRDLTADHTAPATCTWLHNEDPEAYIGYDWPLDRRDTYQPQHQRRAA